MSDPFSAIIGYFGQQETNSANAAIASQTNQMNAEQAQLNRDWQTQMSNTAYQRQVADLQAAGLNPMLAYVKGGGASTPSAPIPTMTSAQYKSPIQGAIESRLTSAQAAKTESEKDKVEAETANVKQVTENLQESLKNISKEGNRLDALVAEIETNRQLLLQKKLTEVEIGNQLRQSITNLQKDERFKELQNELSQNQVDAERKFGNLGREYKQLGPVMDFLKGILLGGKR